MSSAGASDGDEFDDITCSSPEFDGDMIGIAVNGIDEGTETVAGAVVDGDVEATGNEIFLR